MKLYLTATDDRGLSATESVAIQARPARVGFESEPPGVTLTAGLKIAAAPFDLYAIESSPITISAPATVSVDGVEYPFEGWSDGGARVHSIVAGSGGPYVARYAVPKEEPRRRAASPQTRLLRHPSKRTRAHQARFRFSSNQADAWFQCKLDRGRFKPCRSPRLYRHLQTGKHRLRSSAP